MPEVMEWHLGVLKNQSLVCNTRDIGRGTIEIEKFLYSQSFSMSMNLLTLQRVNMLHIEIVLLFSPTTTKYINCTK